MVRFDPGGQSKGKRSGEGELTKHRSTHHPTNYLSAQNPFRSAIYQRDLLPPPPLFFLSLPRLGISDCDAAYLYGARGEGLVGGMGEENIVVLG